MEITYKPVQATDKPLLIDVTSSPDFVYIRRDLKKIEFEGQDGETKTRYEYNEAILTLDEYEDFKNVLISNEINSVENSSAFDNYQTKLNTGVLYSNGKKYKPRYYEDYGKIMKDLETAVALMQTSISELETMLQNSDLTPEQRSTITITVQTLQTNLSNILTQDFAVYDETGTVENMVMMNSAEVIALYFFLYSKKEQYFAEFKLEKELASDEQ